MEFCSKQKSNYKTKYVKILDYLKYINRQYNKL